MPRYIKYPLILLLLILAGTAWFIAVIHVQEPLQADEHVVLPERTMDGEGRYWVGRNWLMPGSDGMHVLYIEGSDLERGIAYGVLGRELIEEQERIFISRIKQMIPREGYLRFLKYFVAWFNRDLDEHVPREYQREIFGVSRSFSDAMDGIGPKFMRALNYHAAHDIGHALQDLALVGCTSFAAWGERTEEGELIVARNFDFWMGDDFSREKLITFIDPDEGIPHVLVSWGGFMGATSAMNLEGLTVTINASRSEPPMGARTPISLLARTIVQYAATLEEAVALAGAYDVFVSESILVATARDGKAIIIEKTPSGMAVHDEDSDLVVCSNHFQSSTFADDPANVANKKESDSMARYERMRHLVDSVGRIDANMAALILRDRKGPGGKWIGNGNPMAINQLIAHHAVIFQPHERRLWISSAPYQCGEFIHYDLREVFGGKVAGALHDTTRTIAADPFILSEEFQHYQNWSALRTKYAAAVASGKMEDLSPEQESAFINANPDSYITYQLLGDVHRLKGDLTKAGTYYEHALQLEVSSLKEQHIIKTRLAECRKGS